MSAEQERAGYIAGTTTLESYTTNGRPGWERRFWKHVEVGPGCWSWNGAMSGSGYGQMTIGGHRRLTHRLSWLLHRGPIAAGMHLDHLCRNTRCVNPDHLEVVTSRENTLRGTNQVARNILSSECVAGHPFDEINTYVNRGKRYCKECRRIHCREYQRRRRLAMRSAT
ncbi:MAG: HNH endonuclease [Actinobacteria bacterium]|nr:HNH endonuclease [Actinomycetota bacterium]MBI3687269.1 HNH endonuclease [Actinomycetota bacterium]